MLVGSKNVTGCLDVGNSSESATRVYTNGFQLFSHLQLVAYFSTQGNLTTHFDEQDLISVAKILFKNV